MRFIKPISVSARTLALCVAVPASLVLSGCDTDSSAVGKLCASQDKSFEYCQCYVEHMETNLNDQEFAMLADIARYQLDDSLTTEETRDQMLEKYEPLDVIKFYSTFIAHQITADLTCKS